MVNDVVHSSSAVCIFLLIVFIHLSIKSTLESDSFTMQALAIFIFMEKFFGLYAPFFRCMYRPGQPNLEYTMLKLQDLSASYLT